MYSNWFRYVCEDCGVREHADRGDIGAIRRFHAAHPGHRTHINDFTQTGPTLEEFLKARDKEIRDSERNQKLVKLLTFGLRGETAADRQRKRDERANLYRKILDGQNPRTTREEEET